MASETVEAQAQAAAQVAAATTQTVVENVTAEALAQVASAERRADAAETVAEALTDAAMMTEIGRRMTVTEEKVSQCSQLVEGVDDRLRFVTTKLAELSAQLLTQSPAPSPTIVLTPPPSSEAPIAVLPTTVETPSVVDEGARAVQKTTRRVTRWI